MMLQLCTILSYVNCFDSTNYYSFVWLLEEICALCTTVLQLCTSIVLGNNLLFLLLLLLFAFGIPGFMFDMC